jgi:hypothetical protein
MMAEHEGDSSATNVRRSASAACISLHPVSRRAGQVSSLDSVSTSSGEPHPHLARTACTHLPPTECGRLMRSGCSRELPSGANTHSKRPPIPPTPSQVVEIRTRETAPCGETVEGGYRARAGKDPARFGLSNLRPD